jgi:hypothetical protein
MQEAANMQEAARMDDAAGMDDAAHSILDSRSCPPPPLSAVDLLALAGSAAARVAGEQSEAVAAAARALDCVARSQGSVWVAGDAANEHARRLEAAGHRALVAVDIDRLPHSLGPSDALLVTVQTEAPCALLAEARRRRIDTIVLAGPSGIDHDHGVVIRVRCYDERALELAHGFIVTALCAEHPELSRAESAA